MSATDDAELDELLAMLPQLHRFFHGFQTGGLKRTPLGLTQHLALVELSLQPNSTLKELSAMLGVTSASLSPIVESLVRAGLLDRIPDPADRRCVRLSVAPGGTEMLNRLHREQAEHWRNNLNRFDPDDRRRMLEALRTLSALTARVQQGSGA